MKWISICLCMVLLFAGCVSKKEKEAAFGPLSKINEYQVFPLFLPNEVSDKKMLLAYLVELLGRLGTVHIATDCISDSSISSAGMVISLGESAQAKTGSINIFIDAEIIINKHKASCEAWKTFYHDPTLSYPVDEEEGMTFKKDLLAESPDLKIVINQMVEQFFKQYRQDNPVSTPTFRVYQSIFTSL